jgi:hypothetical protein
MSMQHETGPGDRLTAANGVNGIVTIAYAVALAFLPFTRRNAGTDWIGRTGLLTGFIILGYMCHTNSPGMMLFFLAWLVALLGHRCNQYQNWRNGVEIHSHYAGDPWLSLRLFPRLSDANARAMDGFLCLIVGVLLVTVDPPMGPFFFAGFVGILVSEAVSHETTRRKLQAMRDAEIEQRYLARRYKEGRF